jgi:AraC-like DNA-binding protein
VLLFLSISGIFLSLLLLYYHGRKVTSSVYLSGFFCTLSFQVLNIYILFYSKSVILVSVFLINFTFLFYLIGPMFYWYMRSTLSDNSQLKKRDLWHLLPSLVFLITSFQYMFTPYSHKVEVATKFVQDINNLIPYEPAVPYRLFSTSVIFLSRPIFVLGYVLWSAGLFIRYLKKRKKKSVISGQHYMITWLSILLGLLFILSVSHILALGHTFASANADLFYTLNVLQVLSGLGLTGLLISPFFFPDILYGLPRLPESFSHLESERAIMHHLLEMGKKHSPNLESHYLHLIGQKTDTWMKEFQPYLQKNFNLTHLSIMINIPVHHLAYFFREERKQTFHDYRNDWRIAHAKDLIKDGKANKMTLEAIGILSGFSTRNTFIIAFKKAEGISPSVYVAKSAKDPQKAV